jgi:hypothetical protein
MKVSTAAIVLSLSGTASAYSVSRSSIRNLGQKSVQVTGPTRSNDSTMKMEGTFTFMLRYVTLRYVTLRSPPLVVCVCVDDRVNRRF